MAKVRNIFGAVVVVVVALMGALAAPAHADTVSDEAAFVDKLNQLRSSRGLRALAPNADLTRVARAWSATMASAGSISHNPSLAQQGPSNWVRLGENVGVGMEVQGLHDAFVNSPTHLKNMVDAGFDAVGVGVVRDGAGKIFVTVNFMTSKAVTVAAAAPAPAPAPPAPARPAPAPAAATPAPTPPPAAAPPAPAAPAPAPVAEAPAPAPVAEAPAPAAAAPMAEPAAQPRPPVPVTRPERRVATVATASASSSPEAALALVAVGLLLVAGSSAVVVPRRRRSVPALARR